MVRNVDHCHKKFDLLTVFDGSKAFLKTMDMSAILSNVAALASVTKVRSNRGYKMITHLD